MKPTNDAQFLTLFTGHVLTCSYAQNVQWWTKMYSDERVFLQWWRI